MILILSLLPILIAFAVTLGWLRWRTTNHLQMKMALHEAGISGADFERLRDQWNERYGGMIDG